MNSQKIGQAINTTGSSCFGITKHPPSTYQCQGISKGSSKNTSIKCQRNRSIAHTLHCQSNAGPKHKPRCLQISPPNYPTKKSRKFNVSSGTFYITHGRLTSSSWWPSVPLQASKCKAQWTRWQKPNNFELPCNASWRDHTVPSIRYGLERPFWHVLPLRDEGA